MLYIIGLGLEDEEITRKGQKYLEKSEIGYAEFYTNTKTINLKTLEEETGTEIQQISRKSVEKEDKILETAKEKDTAFLVSGDPLTATTHYDLVHRARKQNIKVKTAHAPSIFLSVSETGLSIYKFGRTVTLPKQGKPSSIIKHINKNDKIGLHTLILLDIDYDAARASQKLIEMEEKLKNREAILLQRANSETQTITIQKLQEITQTGSTPHAIILTGEKSHKEQENLEYFKK